MKNISQFYSNMIKGISMKFLKSEGRVVCLVEREDAQQPLTASLPSIHPLLMPLHHKDHIENSQLWIPLIKALNHKLNNVIYF